MVLMDRPGTLAGLPVPGHARVDIEAIQGPGLEGKGLVVFGAE